MDAVRVAGSVTSAVERGRRERKVRRVKMVVGRVDGMVCGEEGRGPR